MKYAVVGSGVAGLVVAYKLLEKGHHVVVLEKEGNIGGLSRSFQYGGFIFDIGPHRFFSRNKEVYRFIKFVLKDNYHIIKRRSSIYFSDYYFPWPLDALSLVKLPPHLLIKTLFDLFQKPRSKSKTFKDVAIEKYGKTLFGLIFESYSEKFFGMGCEEPARWCKNQIPWLSLK